VFDLHDGSHPLRTELHRPSSFYPEAYVAMHGPYTITQLSVGYEVLSIRVTRHLPRESVAEPASPGAAAAVTAVVPAVPASPTAMACDSFSFSSVARSYSVSNSTPAIPLGHNSPPSVVCVEPFTCFTLRAESALYKVTVDSDRFVVLRCGAGLAVVLFPFARSRCVPPPPPSPFPAPQQPKPSDPNHFLAQPPLLVPLHTHRTPLFASDHIALQRWPSADPEDGAVFSLTIINPQLTAPAINRVLAQALGDTPLELCALIADYAQST
jgi:hypothetical protein